MPTSRSSWSSAPATAGAVGPERPDADPRNDGPPAASDPGRRPLNIYERETAEALGQLLVQRRRDAGRSQVEVAWASGMNVRSLRRLERGDRRARRSTLERLAAAIAPDDAGIVGALVEAAGDSLAAESLFRERIESRRQRRLVAASRRFISEIEVTWTPDGDGFRETRTNRRRIGRARIVENTRTRCVPDVPEPGPEAVTV